MDNTTFNTLFRKHESNFIGFGIKLTRSESDARDLLQESSIKAYLNIDKFDDTDKFKSWFFKIMYNTFVTNYRKRSRRREIANSIGNTKMYLIANDNVINQGYASLELEDINKCINSLSYANKSTLLQYAEGYQYTEIADKLNIPIGTVKSRISAARKKVSATIRTMNHPMSAAS